MDISISDESKKRTKTGYLLGIFTLFYLLVLPFVFGMALASFMVFGTPKITTTIGSLMVFSFFWIPISIPISIFLMWSNYYKKKYKKASGYILVPILTLLAFFVSIQTLEMILLAL